MARFLSVPSFLAFPFTIFQAVIDDGTPNLKSSSEKRVDTRLKQNTTEPILLNCQNVFYAESERL